VEEKKVVEVSKVEDVLTQKRSELESVESKLREAQESLESATIESQRIVREAQRRGQAVYNDQVSQAQRIVDTARQKASEELTNAEILRKEQHEWKSLAACQKTCAAYRESLSTSESRYRRVFNDLVLVAPLLDGTRQFFDSKDLRSEARERLLSLVSEKVEW
jgi:hypothetical protein